MITVFMLILFLKCEVSLYFKQFFFFFLLMTEVNSVDEQRWNLMHALLLKEKDIENKDPGE